MGSVSIGGTNSDDELIFIGLVGFIFSFWDVYLEYFMGTNGISSHLKVSAGNDVVSSDVAYPFFGCFFHA